MSLKQLQQLNLDGLLTNEEAVSLSAEARMLEQEFQILGQDVPEWLEKASNILREEIARRNRAADFAALKAVEGELESLKSASERKSDAQRRLAVIQQRLGLTAKSGK